MSNSIAQWTGVDGFPGVAFVNAYDAANGYVLATLKPWTVYQPGIDQFVTVSVHATFTVADFQTSAPGMSYAGPNVRQATYDAQRGIWTYPVVDSPYVFI